MDLSLLALLNLLIKLGGTHWRQLRCNRAEIDCFQVDIYSLFRWFCFLCWIVLWECLVFLIGKLYSFMRFGIRLFRYWCWILFGVHPSFGFLLQKQFSFVYIEHVDLPHGISFRVLDLGAWYFKNFINFALRYPLAFKTQPEEIVNFYSLMWL